MITQEKCVDDIKQFYLVHNRIPKANDFRNQNKYVSYSSIQKYCGSWNKALILANLPILNFRKDWSDEDMLGSIQDFYIEFNKVPVASNFSKSLGKYPSPRSIIDRFGNWNNALKLAGFSDKVNAIIRSKEEVISLIQRFVNENNRVPTVRDLAVEEFKWMPSYGQIYGLFGNFGNAVLNAGFIPNSSGNFAKSCLADDGEIYRSKLEVYFVNTYLFNKHKYAYETPYGNGWYYDFYLPESNLYIEIDGGIRPERIKEKVQFNRDNLRKLVVITPDIICNVPFVRNLLR